MFVLNLYKQIRYKKIVAFMFLLQSTCEKLYRNAGVFKVNAKEYQRSIVITLRYSFKTKLKLIFTGLITLRSRYFGKMILLFALLACSQNPTSKHVT